MRAALLFLCLSVLLFLRQSVRAQLLLPPVSVRPLSGIDVSAPRFIEWNATWQFDVALFATEGTLLVPLFHNRSAPPGPPLDACEGFVPLCCLWTLADNFLNSQFAMYLHYLGACEMHAGQLSVDVLTDEPSTNALTLGAFAVPPPTVWRVNNHRCVVQVTETELREPWFTENLGIVSDINGRVVIDRDLDLTIAIIIPMLTPHVKITLSHHRLLFHDSDTPAPEVSNTRHHAFSHSCREAPKPEFALWRADALARDEECIWFCEPGYVMYPATTDAGLRAARYAYECLREPVRAAAYSFRVLIPAPPGGVGITAEQLEAYQAEAITALQGALETALGLPPGSSLLHLQDGGPDGTLDVSIAVFIRHCSRNLSAQVLRISDALEDDETASLFAGNILTALNTTTAPNTTTMTPLFEFDVAGVEQLRPCLLNSSGIPLLALILGIVWGVLLCLCAVYGLFASVRRLRERRARLLRRLAPVAQPAFDPRPHR